MKCIECDQPAEYIYNGNSLCKQHLEFQSVNGKEHETKYYYLLSSFKGSEKTLNYFWDVVGSKFPAFNYKSKCNFLESVNTVVDKFKISHRNINSALGIAVKREQFKIGYIVSIMKSMQAKDDIKNSDYNNDDILTQIAESLN